MSLNIVVVHIVTTYHVEKFYVDFKIINNFHIVDMVIVCIVIIVTWSYVVDLGDILL